MIRSKFYKFFSWLKDHFVLLIEVVFRLRIGGQKKEKPSVSSNPDSEEGRNQEREERVITNEK